MRVTKGRSLGPILLMLIGSFALAGQAWYLVSMSPNDETVTLKSFDGFSAYAWVSPLLLVCLAAMATSAISSGAMRLVSLCSGAASSFALTFLAGFAISTQDLAGLARGLETATGIAATHGISGLTITTQPFALLSVGTFVLTCVFFILAVFTSKNWVSRAGTPSHSSQVQTKDTISLWDEQR
jgi:hypothetical protein